jgi:hypothetical protein
MKGKGPRRDLRKQRFWRHQVVRWRQSRQSVRDYCRDNALSEPSFYAWRRELTRRSQSPKAENRPRPKASHAATTSQDARKRHPRREASKRPSLPPTRRPALRIPRGAPSTPSFLPVRVVQGPAAEAGYPLAGGGVEIVLAQGRMLRVRAGFDRQTLTEVLAVLEARTC